MVMEAIVGKWRFDRSKDTGLKDFFIATGVPEDMRQPLMTIEPLFEWTIEGNRFKQIVNIQGEDQREYQYELGKQFQMEKVKGLKFKCTITWDGEKFIEKYIDFKDEPFENARTIEGNVMKVVTTAKGLSMSQELKRC